METMNDIKRGEIWLANLDPAIGHEIKKTRPVIIIQNNTGNKYSPLTIVAPLTSQRMEKIYPVEVLLTLNNADVDKDSKVLLSQIRTIDKRRLIKKMGNVNLETIELIDEALKISLGL
mgnify:CR=1 FL=1